MSTDNFIMIILLCGIVFFNSCHNNRLVTDARHDSFLYKSLDNAPAYVVKLPVGCKIEGYSIGNSISYHFSYNNTIFYISDEGPLYDSLSSNNFVAIYNNLLKSQDSLRNRINIACSKQGALYEEGGDSLFWKYYIIYNLERPNPALGVSNVGFEYLIVEYTHATPEDTAVFNSYIEKIIKIEMPIKKNKINKFVRYGDYIK